MAYCHENQKTGVEAEMELIQCKPYNATFLNPYTCIQKQKELVEIMKQMKVVKKRRPNIKEKDIRSETPPVRYFALRPCIGCETGLELYRKYLKGELSMEKQTKECPCGVTMTRWEGQNGTSWARTKYCQKCSKLSVRERNKLFKSSVESVVAPKIKKQVETGIPAPTTTEKPIISTENQTEPENQLNNIKRLQRIAPCKGIE